MSKKLSAALGLGLLVITGCQSTSNYSSLSTADAIEVVPSVVENPYPSCNSEEGKDNVRIANLSLSRSQRVYLVGGELCQRD